MKFRVDLKEKLIAGHKKVHEALDDLESYRFNDPSLLNAISNLKSAILIHQSDEQKYLFPILNEEISKNPFIKAAVNILDKSKSEVRTHVSDFFDNYKNKKLTPKLFDAELLKISSYLKNLMKDEEAILYQIINKEK